MVRFRIALTALLFAGTGTALEDADAALITPAPRVPRELYQDRIAVQKRETSRPSPIEFCFGLDGICDLSDNLFGECENLESDDRKWNQCLCGNGAVAVSQACDLCQEAWNVYGWSYDFTDLEQEATSACLHYGFSVAPVPASVLTIESSYNATYTGTVPGNTKKPAVTRKLSSSASKETGTGKDNPNGVSTVSYYSLNGGGGGSGTTPTSNPQSQPSSTSAQTTGAAPGSHSWRAGDTALFSLVILVVATLLLM